jgi:UDP-N-acetylmuramoylalanine--D-glutamate ligase
MSLKKKRVLVVGSGISGMGAVELLVKVAAIPILYEGNEQKTEEEIRTGLTEKGKDIQIIIGKITEDLIATFDLAVISPGVPVDSPLVCKLKEAKIPIWGEVELAFVNSKGRIAAITGTNGKTTTTTLLGEILKAYQENAYIVGNIGIPYTKIALDTDEESLIAAEISSFQLETIHAFQPAVSAILNITPDHLDRHHTLEEYIRVKEQIAVNQTAKETCVLNYEDEHTRKFGENTHTNVLFFSSQRTLEKGIYIEEDSIYINKGTGKEEFCKISELKLLGSHNYENIMAAVGCAISLEIPIEVIRKTVTQFMGVEHRIEYVAEKNGVVYYNDSKGTNPDAAIKGISAMHRPTLLIAGGYDKQATYDEWIQSFQGKVRYLVLIGETKNKIAETAKKYGFDNIIFAETLEEAVQICALKAEVGNAVLLSPACASWGMFPNYEVRGNMFKEYVKKQ